MRRLLLVLLLAMSLVGCSSAERPEGTVERWLTSLNQGEAGSPDRYASDGVTRQVAPTWDTEDPLWIDEITVGTAREAPDGSSHVPFRLVPTGGEPVSGIATVTTRVLEDGSTGTVITDVSIGEVSLGEATWRAGMDRAAWLVAIAIGVTIALAGAVVVGLVDRGSRRRAAP